MSQVLIHSDVATKDEIFRLETERMREAYRLQPDSVDDSDTWELAEEWTDCAGKLATLFVAQRLEKVSGEEGGPEGE